MTETSHPRHLTPEQLVDVLDEAPVDAAVRQHLNACRECAYQHESKELFLQHSGLKQASPLVERDYGNYT